MFIGYNHHWWWLWWRIQTLLHWWWLVRLECLLKRSVIQWTSVTHTHKQKIIIIKSVVDHIITCLFEPINFCWLLQWNKMGENFLFRFFDQSNYCHGYVTVCLCVSQCWLVYQFMIWFLNQINWLNYHGICWNQLFIWCFFYLYFSISNKLLQPLKEPNNYQWQN